MTKKHFYVLTASIIIIAAITGYFYHPDKTNITGGKSDETPETMLLMPKSQLNNKRTWENVKFIVEYTLEDCKDFLLYNPKVIKSDKYGNIYVNDQGDKSVKKFSPEGKYIQKYGRGKGEGPGEFLNPIDFCITDNEDVWICDPKIKNIGIFGKNGNLKQSIKPGLIPYRMVVLKSDEFVIVSPILKINLLTKYDCLGKEINSFGEIIKNQNKKFGIIDGSLKKGLNDDIYYSFYYIGSFISYYPDGRLKYYVETMDKVPIPKIENFTIGSSSGSRLDPKAPLVNRNIEIDSTRVYVYSKLCSELENAVVIDIYNLSDGSYISSYKIDDKSAANSDDFCIYGNSIYLLKNMKITKWNIFR